MAILKVVADAVVEFVLDKVVAKIVRDSGPFLSCRIWRRNEDFRVSYAALLCVAEGDQYVLVRKKRRGHYAPLGGLFKGTPESKPILHGLEFRPERHDQNALGDLRGFLPRRNAAAFDQWFQSGEARETDKDCVMREVNEELSARGLAGVALPTTARFTKLRFVGEGPERPAGEAYAQYRHLRFFDLASYEEPTMRAFVDRLMELGQTNEALLIASADEILRGVARDGRLIANHAAYFFQGQPAARWEPRPVGT
ncbi:MAG: hypothetical protein Q8P50_17250 [Bacillota bacterium]|nr:hypothetical protein [Bacillota bacterium]